MTFWYVRVKGGDIIKPCKDKQGIPEAKIQEGIAEEDNQEEEMKVPKRAQESTAVWTRTPTRSTKQKNEINYII